MKKFTESVNENGEPIKKIYLLENGKEVGYILKNNDVVDSKIGTYYAKDLKTGDVIIPATDKDGYLSSYIYVYSVAQGTVMYASTGVANTNSWNIVTVTGLRNGYIEVEDASNNMYRLRTSDISVYIAKDVNTASANVKISDLTSVTEGESVLYFMVNGTPKAIIIYR